MVKKINTILYAFIGLHILLWTLAPALIRYSLPMDAMEGTTWGHQFEWGYDKNPFMNGWLTALAIKLGGQSGWMTYLFSQLSVAICFWAVWQLGKKLLPPLYALIAVLLLEGIQYYNFHAIDFNDNTLELGAWALTILFFYQATHKKDYTNWLLTGLFAGISMMIKYYVVVLLLPMFAFLLCDREARDNFKHVSLYAGLGIFFLVIAPHVIWLFSHNFITVNYAFERVSSPPKWWVHCFYPAQFTWQMFDTFLPAGLLFSVLIFGKFFKDSVDVNNHEVKMNALNKSDTLFLLLTGFGPFLLTVLISAISGFKLRAGWGQPLMSLWGLILLATVRPTITPKQFYRFLSTLAVILAVAVSGYCIALIRGAQKDWLKVNANTLQHMDYKNIFGIGDVTGVPNSKTAATIRAQAPIVVENLLAAARDEAPTMQYNGYSACPLITGKGKVILAEFGYDGKLLPSFPFDMTKERWSMWLLKRYFFPQLYWHGMLKGTV